MRVAKLSSQGRLLRPWTSLSNNVSSKLPRCRCVRSSATPDPDAGTSSMSIEVAEQTLKVDRHSDFDSIMRAKEAQKKKAAGDQDKIFMIEAAYDVMLMQNMRARMSGNMKVDNSVRFADVQSRQSAKQVQQTMMSKLPGGGVTLSVPPNDQLAVLAASYSALVLWAFVQGATEPYAAQQADVAGLQLALGFSGAVYFLREKKRLGLGRSFSYAAGGLVFGAVIGNLMEAWLRVDIVPILGMGSPGVFVGEFGLLGVALAAALLA